jgi:hypothetical protein
MTLPNDFREQLPELLDERAPPRAPEGLFDRFAERMESARQRPGWATGERWFPMTTRVHVDQARRMAVMVGALLLLALTLAATFAIGSRLVSSTIVVAPDDSGDVTTIGEGVAMAADGDTILVRPGTYVEVVTITKDLEIRGDGAIESIVVRATDDGPSIETGVLAKRPIVDQRYAILIVDADATLSGLTFAGLSSAVVAIGGAPTITGNHFEAVGSEQSIEGSERLRAEAVVGINAIAVGGGSRAIIRGNRVVDSGPIASYDLSEPRIEGNELTGGAHILGGFGDGAEIRDNLVKWSDWGIESRGDTAPLIEQNTTTEVAFPIYAEQGSAIIRGNYVEHDSSSDAGIQYHDGSGTIASNTVNGYARGVAVSGFDGAISGNTIDSGFEGLHVTDSNGTVIDNHITAVFTGINLSRSSSDIVDNTIEGSVTGVAVSGEGSAPTFSGNQLCETIRSVSASDGAAEPDPSGLGPCEKT